MGATRMMHGKQVGTVQQLNIYPVKSMRGQAVQVAALYWYGFDGDRRYAFVRGNVTSNFPWLTGRQIPELVLYTPHFTNPTDPNGSPIEVKTPNGRFLAIDSRELKRELAAEYGGEISLLHLNRGTFDAQQLSLVTTSTIEAVEKLVGEPVGLARFRQNIVINTERGDPFAEEAWLGSLLTFGDRPNSARVRLNRRIKRCVMINIDPETAVKTPAVLKAVAQQRANCVGVYASTEAVGTIRVGDAVWLSNGLPLLQESP